MPEWVTPVFDNWRDVWTRSFVYIRDTLIPEVLPDIVTKYGDTLKTLSPAISAAIGLAFGSPFTKVFSATVIVNEFEKVKTYLQNTEFYSDIEQFIGNVVDPLLNEWSTGLQANLSDKGHDVMISDIKDYIDSFLRWWGEGGSSVIADAARELNRDIIGIINSSINIVIALLDIFVSLGSAISGVNLDRYKSIETFTWDEVIDRILDMMDWLADVLETIASALDDLANEEYGSFVATIDNALAVVIDKLIDTIFGVINYVIDQFQGDALDTDMPPAWITSFHESLRENWEKTLNNLFGGSEPTPPNGHGPVRDAPPPSESDNLFRELISNPYIAVGGLVAGGITAKALITSIPNAIKGVVAGLAFRQTATGGGGIGSSGVGGFPTVTTPTSKATYQAYQQSLETVNEQLRAQTGVIDNLTGTNSAYAAAVNRNARILDSVLDLDIPSGAPKELDDLRALLQGRATIASEIDAARTAAEVAYGDVKSPLIDMYKAELSGLSGELSDFEKQFGNLINQSSDDIARIVSGFSPDILRQMPSGESGKYVLDVMKEFLGADNPELVRMIDNMKQAGIDHKEIVTATLNDLNSTYDELINSHASMEEKLSNAVMDELNIRKSHYEDLIRLEQGLTTEIDKTASSIERNALRLNDQLQDGFRVAGEGLETATIDADRLATEAENLSDQLKTMVPEESPGILRRSGRFLLRGVAAAGAIADALTVIDAIGERMDESAGETQRSTWERFKDFYQDPEDIVTDAFSSIEGFTNTVKGIGDVIASMLTLEDTRIEDLSNRNAFPFLSWLGDKMIEVLDSPLRGDTTTRPTGPPTDSQPSGLDWLPIHQQAKDYSGSIGPSAGHMRDYGALRRIQEATQNANRQGENSFRDFSTSAADATTKVTYDYEQMTANILINNRLVAGSTIDMWDNIQKTATEKLLEWLQFSSILSGQEIFDLVFPEPKIKFPTLEPETVSEWFMGVQAVFHGFADETDLVAQFNVGKPIVRWPLPSEMAAMADTQTEWYHAVLAASQGLFNSQTDTERVDPEILVNIPTIKWPEIEDMDELVTSQSIWYQTVIAQLTGQVTDGIITPTIDVDDPKIDVPEISSAEITSQSAWYHAVIGELMGMLTIGWVQPQVKIEKPVIDLPDYENVVVDQWSIFDKFASSLQFTEVTSQTVKIDQPVIDGPDYGTVFDYQWGRFDAFADSLKFDEYIIQTVEIADPIIDLPDYGTVFDYQWSLFDEFASSLKFTKTVSQTVYVKTKTVKTGDDFTGSPNGGGVYTDPSGRSWDEGDIIVQYGRRYRIIGGIPTPLQSGGMLLSEGLAYLHPNEMVLPAARAEKLSDTDLSLMSTSKNLDRTVQRLESTINQLQKKLGNGGDTYTTYVETNADPDQIGQAIAFESRLR